MEQFIETHIGCNVTQIITHFVNPVDKNKFEMNFELLRDVDDTKIEDEEDYEYDVLQYFIVSSWLFDRLQEKNEQIFDFGTCYVWGRTTFGQSTTLDVVLQKIAIENNYLTGIEDDN